jgi:hypothetical protein
MLHFGLLKNFIFHARRKLDASNLPHLIDRAYQLGILNIKQPGELTDKEIQSIENIIKDRIIKKLKEL